MRDDRALREGLNARFFAAAEVKLKRPLTPGEKHVDVVEILTALEAGKERLHKAILKEQLRVAEHAANGRVDVEMKVTDEMVASLNWLREQGQREARKELARHGIKPTARTYARPKSAAIKKLVNRLAGFLPSISARVKRRSVELQLSQEPIRAVLNSAARIPGALNAAGQLVSSAYYAGMGDVFSASADVISGWTYSAVLDGGTCQSCESMDGTEYETWEDAQGDMPDGGPNPDCDGEGRCRCRLVPNGPAEGYGPQPGDEQLPPQVQEDLANAKQFPDIVDRATADELAGFGMETETEQTVANMDKLFGDYGTPLADFRSGLTDPGSLASRQTEAYDMYRSPTAYSQFETKLRSGDLTGDLVLPQGSFRASNIEVKKLLTDEGFKGVRTAKAADAAGVRGVDLHIPFKQLVDTMDELLAKAPPLPRETTFYRGSQTLNRIFGPDGPKVGESYVDKAYVSVSADPEVAQMFAKGLSGIKRGEGGDAVIEIKAPRGTRGMWARSTGQDEIFEYTLPRDSKIVVDKIETVHVPAGEGDLVPDLALAHDQTYITAHLEPYSTGKATVVRSKASGEGAIRAEVKERSKARKTGETREQVMARVDKEIKLAAAQPAIVDLAPVVTDDVSKAADAIARGMNVTLNRPDEIATLLDKLSQIAKDAQAKGTKAPKYDLGKVTIKGTNLFTHDSIGVSRANMPQLKGNPAPGSKADLLPRDKRGEVDIAPLFYQSLKDKGIGVRSENMLASHMKATQTELDGEKVAGIMKFLDGGGKLDGVIPVSKDGYIVDGHHRWAAEIGRDYKTGADAHMTIPVEVIDQDIVTILHEANAFASEYGIPQAAFGAPMPVPSGLIKDGLKATKQATDTLKELPLKLNGFKVESRPPTDAVSMQRRIKSLRATMDLASDQELVDAANRIVLEEEREAAGLVPERKDVLKDMFVGAEWDLVLTEEGLFGARAFFTRENGKIKLMIETKRGKKFAAVDDVKDFAKKAANQQQQQASQQRIAPIPTVTNLEPASLSAILQEPKDATNIVYFGVPASPVGDGRYVGCVRMFEDHYGHTQMQTCQQGGKWNYVPPPPLMDLATMKHITQRVAADVYVRTLASVSLVGA